MELQISSDIRKFKTKDVGAFSFKEAGFIALAGACAYGSYIFQKKVLNLEEIQVILLAPLPLIILAIGFVKPFGMSFLQFLRTVFAEWVIDPKIYIWESDFVFDLDEKGLAKDEKGKDRLLTEGQKMAYMLSDEVVTVPLGKTHKEIKEREAEIKSHII